MAMSSDMSLFVYKHDSDIAYLLLYVEDIVLMTSSSTLLRRITSHLSGTFAMKDLGPLHYFLDIHVHWSVSGFFLHHAKYAEDILDHASMLNCKSSPTPVDTSPKSSATTGELAHDASFYRNITSALQYLTLTRSDIAYAVHQVCLHMHARVIRIGHSSSRFCDTSVAPPAMVCIRSVWLAFRFGCTPTLT
jgi:hypothetical protein